MIAGTQIIGSERQGATKGMGRWVVCSGLHAILRINSFFHSQEEKRWEQNWVLFL